MTFLTALIFYLFICQYHPQLFLSASKTFDWSVALSAIVRLPCATQAPYLSPEQAPASIAQSSASNDRSPFSAALCLKRTPLITFPAFRSRLLVALLSF